MSERYSSFASISKYYVGWAERSVGYVTWLSTWNFCSSNFGDRIRRANWCNVRSSLTWRRIPQQQIEWSFVSPFFPSKWQKPNSQTAIKWNKRCIWPKFPLHIVTFLSHIFLLSDCSNVRPQRKRFFLCFPSRFEMEKFCNIERVGWQYEKNVNLVPKSVVEWRIQLRMLAALNNVWAWSFQLSEPN